MNDILTFLQWYVMLLILGLILYPLTSLIFSSFFDKGYIFSKVIGALVLSYLLFLLGTLHILPFTNTSVLIVIILLIVINFFIAKTYKGLLFTKQSFRLLVIEEGLFLLSLAVWTFIRAHEPSINGLEKFMDYGFINSILRTNYFPPTDMWFPPFPINYYYFGHLVTAVLTKISLLPSNYTYNLMVSTIFAITIVGSFSIGYTLSQYLKAPVRRSIIAGILSGLLVGVAGNLHTLYAFFSAYTPAENPVPLWKLAFKPLELFTTNGYWYPNATRFIPNTIHEFPLYSFVVSDLHGHVLDIPVVLLCIAFLLHILFKKIFTIIDGIMLGFVLSVMFMTNVLDFGVYSLLSIGFIVYIFFSQRPTSTKKRKNSDSIFYISRKNILYLIKIFGSVFLSAVVFTLPFSIHFKPFASGIGILCAPEILTNKGSLGPFLFEANHCQRSEWWMLVTLYAFFYFFVGVFLVYLWRNKNIIHKTPYIFCSITIIISSLLILIPEFAYIKDIYPDHYRANTMFKLTYQAFIMLSIVSAFIITNIVIPKKNVLLLAITFLLVAIVLLYPRFAVYSYYNSLGQYHGIDGTAYLKDRYPADYEAIQWINKYIHGQPVVLESQGDSYTDHARISSNTGLPTVLGWTVHQWLWRGSYDIPAPRITDVQTLYETTDLQIARDLLGKYNVEYVYIGNLEREKYTNISENKFSSLGNVIYKNSDVTIYRISLL